MSVGDRAAVFNFDRVGPLRPVQVTFIEQERQRLSGRRGAVFDHQLTVAQVTYNIGNGPGYSFRGNLLFLSSIESGFGLGGSSHNHGGMMQDNLQTAGLMACQIASFRFFQPDPANGGLRALGEIL